MAYLTPTNTPPSRGALQGLQCVDTTEPQKTSYCRALPEFSERYALAREAGIRAGIHEIGICIAVLVTKPVTTEKRDACGCCVTVPVTLSFP